MNAHPSISRLQVGRIVGKLVLVAPVLAMAADPIPADVLHVKVFPNHYAVAEQRFGDVAALAALLTPSDERVVRLEHCGLVSAGKLVAAVERLHLAHAGVLEVRALPGGQPECASTPEWRSGEGVGALVNDSAYLATDRSGQSIMP